MCVGVGLWQPTKEGMETTMSSPISSQVGACPGAPARQRYASQYNNNIGGGNPAAALLMSATSGERVYRSLDNEFDAAAAAETVHSASVAMRSLNL